VISTFDEQYMYVIPLFALDVIWYRILIKERI
jgi:hypothetical protein